MKIIEAVVVLQEHDQYNHRDGVIFSTDCHRNTVHTVNAPVCLITKIFPLPSTWYNSITHLEFLPTDLSLVLPPLAFLVNLRHVLVLPKCPGCLQTARLLIGTRPRMPPSHPCLLESVHRVDVSGLLVVWSVLQRLLLRVLHYPSQFWQAAVVSLHPPTCLQKRRL